MFLFNKDKGAAMPTSSKSRRPSAEFGPGDMSQENTLPTSSHSSQQEFPSPDRRRGSSARRASVFALRSRSNTATSTVSNTFISRTSTMAADDRRSSQDLSEGPPQSTDASQKGKNLFSRGKRLRRQSSKLTSLALEEAEEMPGNRRASILRKAKGLKDGSGARMDVSKHLISDPFDFKHLTHTHPQQFNDLERTTQNELVAEFWAVRASQAPKRELHGIQAEDLQLRNFSADDLSPTQRPVSPRGEDTPTPLRSPTMLSPQHSRPSSRGLSSPRAERNLRHVPSTEGLSPKTAVRPPRRSSRAALTYMDNEAPACRADGASGPSGLSKVSGIWGRSLSIGTIELPARNVLNVPHAYRTPDEIAIPAISPSCLDLVPEEPESYFNPRPAPRPPIRRNMSSDSGVRQRLFPPTALAPFQARSHELLPEANEPVSPRGGPLSPRGGPLSPGSEIIRPPSQMSDTLGSPFKPAQRRVSIARANANRRQSVLQRHIDSSWEADIDYCYDHELEADCEYDWDRRSSEGDDGHHEAEHSARMEFSLQSHGGKSVEGMSTRDRGALSVSTASAVAPNDIFTSAPGDRRLSTVPSEGEGFTLLTPSLLIPPDPKFLAMREEIYEEILEDYDNSERHYPLLDPSAPSVASSSRSSRTRLSKRSSYDSSVKSLRYSLNSPNRRSASSASSLPELVPSSSRRQQRVTFDKMADHLCEQMARISYASLDDYNDDQEEGDQEEGDKRGKETEAARVSEDSTATVGTFFAADDNDDEDAIRTAAAEDPEHLLHAVTTEAAIPATSHARAASDSATKLLLMAKMPSATASSLPAAAPKGRQRAASVAGKPAYTLFPEVQRRGTGRGSP